MGFAHFAFNKHPKFALVPVPSKCQPVFANLTNVAIVCKRGMETESHDLIQSHVERNLFEQKQKHFSWSQ